LASLDGTVVSDEEQPKPLRRALVTLSRRGLTDVEGGRSSTGGRTVITDDQGRFHFGDLVAGQYGLTASKEAFVQRSFGSSRPAPTGRSNAPPALSLRAGELRTITIRLPRGAVISGTVTDADGQPVGGIPITALADQFDPATGGRRLRPTGLTAGAATDDRGEYRIYGLPAGTYVIVAQPASRFGVDGPVLSRSASESRRVVPAPTYYPSTQDAAAASRIPIIAGEKRDGVDLQVQYVPTATITGVVAADDTAPLVNVRVALMRANEPLTASALISATNAGADGQFTFHGLAPGRYTVRIQSWGPGGSDPTLRWGATDVAVDGEDVANVSIQLLPTVSVSGKVVFDGSSAPRTPGAFRASLPLVPAMPTGLPGQIPSLQFFDDGRFTISGIVPGNYLMGPPGFAARGLRTPIGAWWVKSIVLEGRELLDAPLDISHDSRDAVVTLTDQPSGVAGAVKNTSGDPVVGALVVVFSADRTFWFVDSRRVVGVYADAQGRYTIRNLPPGEYRAIVAQDLETGEWYDPDALQRLLPAAVPFTIAGVEAKTVDLVIR
jgi:protocatechuate 3,4-dioxygenase beta subunit